MLILDTNTISYYFRGDPAVTGRLQALTPSEVTVPAIVEYELRYGLQRLPGEAARPRLEALNTFLQPLTILPFDSRAAQYAAVIRAELEAAGTPIDLHDLLIAATALRHGATLVTRNVREFARVPGLLWENWHDQ